MEIETLKRYADSLKKYNLIDIIEHDRIYMKINLMEENK